MLSYVPVIACVKMTEPIANSSGYIVAKCVYEGSFQFSVWYSVVRFLVFSVIHANEILL